MKNTPITLTLVLEEVNGILMALGQLPYAQIAGLVEKVREQATSQVPVPTPATEVVADEPETMQ
jgi:hypothetical protein